MKNQILKYIDKIKQVDSNYFAGSTCFLINFLELTKLEIKNKIDFTNINDLIKLNYYLIEEDSHLFDLTNMKPSNKMIFIYNELYNQTNEIINSTEQCITCCCNTERYRLLNITNNYLHSLVSDLQTIFTLDLKVVLSNISLPTNKNLTSKDLSLLTYHATLAFLEKLIKRKQKFKNLDNLPLHETIDLIEQELTKSNIDLTTLDQIITKEIIIQEKIKSSIKKDYILVYKLLKEIKGEQINGDASILF